MLRENSSSVKSAMGEIETFHSRIFYGVRFERERESLEFRFFVTFMPIVANS